MATEYRQRPGLGDNFDDEDLVMSSAQQRRNWRGILIALMVIVAVLAMIVTSVVLLTPPQPEELSDPYSNLGNGGRDGSDYFYNQRANDELWWRRRGMRPLRLSDLLTDSASIKTFNGTWISGNEVFYVTSSGGLAVMKITADATIQIIKRIMARQTIQCLKGPIISFELSPDRKHVLIGHDAKKLFRYSKTARYTVYTVSTRQMTPIFLDDHHRRNESNSTDLQPYLLHAQWHKISSTTGDGVESMAIIAVYRYDVFYVPWSLQLSETVTDTSTGKNNVTTSPRTANTTNPQTLSSAPTESDKHNDDELDFSSTEPLWEPWLHGPIRRITTSGSGTSASAVGVVSNGVADYLYEMEILKKSSAVWPSSGRYLMYATFDDRRVGDYKYSVYMKNGGPRDEENENRESEKHSRQRKQQRKRKRRRKRTNRNAKLDATADTKKEDKTSKYYLYPKIHTIKYPKANTPNPIVTLSVIVNLDQLGDPQVQPKIRTLTPPPIFQYTDDYYFTAVQWVNDGGSGGSHEVDDDKSGASPAEVCVVWLNRAQNTSVTTLCKSPMWMCQVTQVINAVGASGGSGSGSDVSNEQATDTYSGDRARRRYRRNGDGPLKSPPETAHKTTDNHYRNSNNNNNNASSAFDRQGNRYRRRQLRQHGQRPHNSRQRRAEDANGDGGGHGGTARRRHGGWVDAAVGGAGGGVPSTGGGVADVVNSAYASTWWSGPVGDGENFSGDDGYVGIAGVGGPATGAGYAAATLVRKGWETGDKELTPRVPVFAADGQGYVSVAPVRDDASDDDGDPFDSGKGGVRLRRPAPPKPHSHDKDGMDQTPAGKYYAQVVAVNITKKLLAPLTFGEPEAGKENKNDRNSDTKSWSVVRILAWDQRTDMIYFLAVPSGRGAPHHRHLYAVKFTSPTPVSTTNTDANSRTGHYHQQQYRKNTHFSFRNRPVCLSCDVGFSDSTHQRKRRDNGGKQNRMDEARDDRLRQQQRERWEHQKEEENDAKEAMTAEEAERRQQRNRRQETQKPGTTRHCTYYDAQFSRDGSHYALVCLGPSVPYVTLHRIMTDDNNDNIDNNHSDGNDEVDSLPHYTEKWTKNSSYSFEFVALVENNTRLQDKYTNRVLLPGTRTFQLRLSGGRKRTTSGGLHFDDPLAAADYYSNGGGQQIHFSSKKRQDSDPLTVAQVRLYLPLSVYDPEADPRPEFMVNHASNSDSNVGKVDNTFSEVTSKTNHSPQSTHNHHRRRRSSSSASSSRDNKENSNDGSKRQRRPHKQQRQRRYKKLYPMIVVVNSDPGSQAITDRFSDRLGYTTGLLCSGSLGRTFPIAGDGNTAGANHGGDKWDRRKQNGQRNRRSAANRYYSSSHLDNENDESYSYDQYDNENTNNNEYVVAVIDPGRGTWARGYESLLALNYGDVNDEYEDNNNGEDYELGGQLGTADIRDQMEAVEYLLSSASTTSESYKDNEQGYYSEDRPRGGRGSRDRSRWFPSSSQSNRRYYSDDDDDDDVEYYDNDSDYTENGNENDNDYYYYYYSNGGGNSDYGGGYRGDDSRRDGDGKKTRRDRRSASDTKTNADALRLPYVDATRVAVLGGGPTSPSTPSSIYGGYAAGRMALWQSNYGGAPIEKKSGESENNRNRKEPVAIHSSFKCAVTMAPVCSWRLYASAFAERYYGYYNGNDGDDWMSYDRSDLIPLTAPLNDSSFSSSSNGKGINLLVMHGTADTTIHPQHSMMLVRGVMQQQQYVPTGWGGNLGRRNNNFTASGVRVSSGFNFRTGPIRISQLVMPDVDLSNSRMASGTENDSPMDHQHQLLYSIYGHITQYLANECFTSANDRSRGRGVGIRGRPSRKQRRRRWRTGNRGQDDPDDQREKEHYSQYQQNQRTVSGNVKSDLGASNDNSDDDRSRGNSGRFRRHNIDDGKHIPESMMQGSKDVENIKVNGRSYDYNNKTSSIGGKNNFVDNLRSINNSKASTTVNNKKPNEDGDDDDDHKSYDNKKNNDKKDDSQ